MLPYFLGVSVLFPTQGPRDGRTWVHEPLHLLARNTTVRQKLSVKYRVKKTE